MFKKIFLIILLIIPYSCFANTAVYNNYENAVSLSDGTGLPLLVIFGSNDCRHCKLVINDIKNGHFDDALDGVIVCYVDITKEKRLKKELGIKTIPDCRMFQFKTFKGKIIGYDKISFNEWLINVRSK